MSTTFRDFREGQRHAMMRLNSALRRFKLKRCVSIGRPLRLTAAVSGKLSATQAQALDHLAQQPADAQGQRLPALAVLLSDGPSSAGMAPSEAAAQAIGA